MTLVHTRTEIQRIINFIVNTHRFYSLDNKYMKFNSFIFPEQQSIKGAISGGRVKIN